ncbi:hypothetical protein VARIO8X_120634 [Burkholderiales bacterium 8X]|nr:hypothetical protein VARIO8X_120634 [Burkholderiales bacterium 8X]
MGPEAVRRRAAATRDRAGDAQEACLGVGGRSDQRAGRGNRGQALPAAGRPGHRSRRRHRFDRASVDHRRPSRTALVVAARARFGRFGVPDRGRRDAGKERRNAGLAAWKQRKPGDCFQPGQPS